MDSYSRGHDAVISNLSDRPEGLCLLKRAEFVGVRIEARDKLQVEPVRC